MNERTIVFSDVDGTLLDSRKKITPLTLRAVTQLKEKGIPFVIVSARSPSGLYPIWKEYDFRCPLICYSGALILDEDGKPLFHRGMQKAEAGRITGFLEQFDVTWNVFSFDEWIVKDKSDPRVIKEEGIVRASSVQGSAQTAAQDEIHKVLCMCEPEQTELVEARLKAEFPQYSIVKSSDVLLEIMQSGITKAAAVNWFCEYCRMNPAQAVAFGDHYNDVEMLETVGFGYLMGNAPAPLKGRIARSTADNDHDGIYHALNALGLVGE